MTLKKAPEPQGYELFGPGPKFPDFPYGEWKMRLDKARKLMRENQIDLLMLWSRQNCRYFTGFTSVHWHLPSLQPMVALIPVEGEPVVLTGEFFRWTVEAQSWIRNIWSPEATHSIEAERGFPKEVAAATKEMGFGNATIALEMGELGHIWIPRPLNDIQTLINELPNAKFVDGDKVIWGCRMIKSPLEIDRLTTAAAIHKTAMAAVVDGYRPGMTEQDITKIFICTAYEQGADWVPSGHIMCGRDKEGMWDTDHHFDGVTVNKGDYLSVDIGVRYKGYWADMGRMINVGPPTETWKQAWETIARGFDAAAATARPGIPIRKVWKAVNEVVTGGGLMGFEMYGHCIGLDIQEPPVLDSTEETLLQPGMTFEVESLGMLGLRRMGGEGTFQYENLLIITEDGCNTVMGIPKELMETAYS